MFKKIDTFNFKKQSSIFKNLTLLVYKSFIKEPRSIIFMLIVPIFFSVMFFFIFKEKSGQYAGSLLLNYALLPCLTVLTSLTPAIVEWKNSVFLKRIDITGVKKSMFIASIWLVYLLAGLFFYILVFSFNLVFSIAVLGTNNSNSLLQSFKTINFGYLLLAIILICATSIALATLFGGIANSSGSIQGVVMMVYFFSIFLSGVMLPADSLYSNKGIVIFTYFIPHKYPVFLYMYALDSERWLSSVSGSQGIVKSFTSSWQPIVGSLAILAGLFTLTTFTFKWTAKR
ncbi:ABC transporter ATP-binding protein [Mesoplasma entomophilum]|uniref:ABC transporter permease n=1 Tax=Mesoplasma entomophilum TaxID=2149 RepID=A0A3S5XZX5_9MOLU|nr:ABC transporter permease [Mesoplasma entomophilum]ATQ35818.1 ABC transporter permease [Mesoplasma entomophilum]ATZ19788.1 ABC transporter ATP-binding protein [Mesoplasma entomophilum]